MALIELKGDLFESTTIAIGHDCNTKGYMGAGIAKTFRDKYTEMFKWYSSGCKGLCFDIGDIFVWQHGNRIIYNLMTQPDIGSCASIKAIESALTKTCTDLKKKGLREIALPRIGCGIGGLDWLTEVKPVIERLSKEQEVDIIVYFL